MLWAAVTRLELAWSFVLEFDSDSALIGNLLALIARAKKLLGRGKTKYIKNIERQL